MVPLGVSRGGVIFEEGSEGFSPLLPYVLQC